MSRLVSSARIAEITGFSQRWVRNMATAGEIPSAVKLGGA